jgi:putative colanic acid biosynthesis glycosyltransferase
LTKFLSIVSITKNDLSGIERTIKSISGQSSVDIELIIVAPAGDPVFGSQYLQNSMLETRAIYQSGQGIYNAMNDGLNLAIGDYVTFLNGGDELFDLDGCLAEISNDHKSDVLLFDTIEQDDSEIRGTNWYYKKTRTADTIDHSMPTHHQSFIYKTALAKSVMYDESFLYAGDYDFTARVLDIAESVMCFNRPFSIFHLGGISQQVSRKKMFVEIDRVKKGPLNHSYVTRRIFAFKHCILHLLRFRFARLYKWLRYNSAICKNCLGALKKKTCGIHVCDKCKIGYSQTSKKVNYTDETHQSASDPRWKEFSQRDIALIQGFLPKNILANKRILEIGPGSGTLLEQLKNIGCRSLSFCEANVNLAESLCDKGFSQALSPFECDDLEKLLDVMKEYDLIIFNHVVEHFDDPVKFLQTIDSKVHADLLFFQTDYTSGLAQILGGFWPGLQLKQHRAHFSIVAFSKLFRHHRLMSLPYWLDYRPRKWNLPNLVKFMIEKCIKYNIFRKEDAFVVYLTRE